MRPIYYLYRLYHLHRLTPLLVMMLAAAAILPSAGCGGAHRATSAIGAPGVSPGGRAVLRLRWPQRDDTTRKIPAATESVRISLWKDGAEIAGKSLNRPPSGSPTVTATFENLPSGSLTVRVAAYPRADAGGVVLAKAESLVDVVAEKTAEVSVSLASVIRTLAVTTESGISELYLGDDAALIVSARDAAGELIPVAPSDLSFTSSSPGVATVDAAGSVHGVGVGDATLTVRETDSGATATLPIQVMKRALYAARGNYGPTDANMVSLYRVEEDARFTPLAPATAKAELYPSGIVQHPTKPYLYVVNTFHSNANGRISQYRIRPDGQLVPLNTPSVETALFPRDLCITPDGKFAYVNCQGKICQYRVNGDGTLSPLVPFFGGVYTGNNWSSSMVMAPQGGYVLVKTGAIISYRIGGDGQLSQVQVTFDFGETLLFHPSGRTFYAYGDTYTPYSFNPAAGTISRLTGSIAVPLLNVDVMVFSPSGQRVYLSYQRQTTYVMEVDSNGAFHNPVPASPDQAVPAIDLHAHPNGRYLYAWYSSQFVPQCDIFEINPANGLLTRRGQASPDGFGGRYFYNDSTE